MNDPTQHILEDEQQLQLSAARLRSYQLPLIFDLRSFAEHLKIDLIDLEKILLAPSKLYKTVKIPKRAGDFRELNIPHIHLRKIQRWILDNILNKIAISVNATGFSPNKSIYDNAQKHLEKSCVLNMDINNFFTSITISKVMQIFSFHGYTFEVAQHLASICTYHDFLPQGSPTSPYLSNIVCIELDYALSALAKNYGASYTRYADDITFSGSNEIINMIPLIEAQLCKEGFRVNSKKTRYSFSHQRQEVTGLVVNNEIVRVKKNYKKEILKELYFCLKFGVTSHTQRTNQNIMTYKEKLLGKINFIRQIEMAEGEKLLALFKQIS